MEKTKFISATVSILVTIPLITAIFEDNKIDFWTDRHDELIIHFRFNNITNRLEMKEHFKEPNGKSVLTTASSDISDDKIQKNEINAEKKSQDNTTSEDIAVAASEKQTTTTSTTVASLKKSENEIARSRVESTTSNGSTTAAHKETLEISTVNPLSIDSCSRNCANETHIACGNNWAFSPDCGQSPNIVDLNPHQQLIVDLHNDFRNQLAGNLTKFEPAVRMGTVQWHDELAKYALLNAMKCDDEHDWCHNTNDFHRAGQNLARKIWTGRKQHNSVENIITKMIMGWYEESQYARQADMDNFQTNLVDNEEISHFATMINERNTHIGCAAVQMVHKDHRMVMFFTCNYARNNIFDVPIYVKGPTGSQCVTGPNPNYSSLCSANEVYDYNN